MKVLTSHHSSAPSSVEKQKHVMLCTVPRGDITTWAVEQCASFLMSMLRARPNNPVPTLLPSLLPSLLQDYSSRGMVIDGIFLCWDHLDMGHRLPNCLACSYGGACYIRQFVPLMLSIYFKLAVHNYLLLSYSMLTWELSYSWKETAVRCAVRFKK